MLKQLVGLLQDTVRQPANDNGDRINTVKLESFGDINFVEEGFQYSVTFSLFGIQCEQLATAPDLAQELGEAFYVGHSVQPEQHTFLCIEVSNNNQFVISTYMQFKLYQDMLSEDSCIFHGYFIHPIAKGVFSTKSSIDRTIEEITSKEYNLIKIINPEMKTERNRLYCYWIKKRILPADIVKLISSSDMCDGLELKTYVDHLELKTYMDYLLFD